MRFERNKNPKETIGIGLEPLSVPISKMLGEIYLLWSKKGQRKKDETYKLKKRWWIPLKWVLPLLNKEGVSFIKLRMFFKARIEYGDPLEKVFQILFPWLFIRTRNRRIKRNKPYAKIDTWGYFKVKTYSDSHENQSHVSFSIISEDIKKVEKIAGVVDNEKFGLKGVIYNGKIYEIKVGNKKIY